MDELSQVVRMLSMEKNGKKGTRHESRWCNQDIEVDVLLFSCANMQRRKKGRAAKWSV